jgi:uncharacterized membrane protein YgdD (TMEM256/DUF423 family)
MNGKKWILIGATLAGLAVILGAFGAHGLENYLRDQEPAEVAKRIDNWKTGAMYQFFHALGIILVGIVLVVSQNSNIGMLQLAGWLMVMGIILFSAMLYLLTLTQCRVGVVVPLGGMAFIAGWAAFAIGVCQIDFRKTAE